MALEDDRDQTDSGRGPNTIVPIPGAPKRPQRFRFSFAPHAGTGTSPTHRTPLHLLPDLDDPAPTGASPRIDPADKPVDASASRPDDRRAAQVVARQGCAAALVAASFACAVWAILPPMSDVDQSAFQPARITFAARPDAQTVAARQQAPFAALTGTEILFHGKALRDYSPVMPRAQKPVTRSAAAALQPLDTAPAPFAQPADSAAGPVLMAQAPLPGVAPKAAANPIGAAKASLRGVRLLTADRPALALPQLVSAAAPGDARFSPPAPADAFKNVIDVSLARDTPREIERPRIRPATLKVTAADRAAAAAQPPSRIVVHFNPQQAPVEAHLVATQLKASGLKGVELRAVTIEVPFNNTRYFHRTDRGLADRVQQVLAKNLMRARESDFTHFEPQPSPGLIEVWITR